MARQYDDTGGTTALIAICHHRWVRLNPSRRFVAECCQLSKPAAPSIQLPTGLACGFGSQPGGIRPSHFDHRHIRPRSALCETRGSALRMSKPLRCAETRSPASSIAEPAPPPAMQPAMPPSSVMNSRLLTRSHRRRGREPAAAR